jgi:hypothetical protein
MEQSRVARHHHILLHTHILNHPSARMQVSNDIVICHIHDMSGRANEPSRNSVHILGSNACNVNKYAVVSPFFLVTEEEESKKKM